MGTVVLGEKLTIEKFIEIAVFHSEVGFSQEYRERVEKSRGIIEACVEKEKAVYGTTTGFGALVSQFITKDEAELLQKNIILTATESLTMNSRPKDPKTARNKNVLIIGGSGSGKNVSIA